MPNEPKHDEECPLSFSLTYVKAEDTKSNQAKWLIAISCSRCHEALVDYLDLKEARHVCQT